MTSENISFRLNVGYSLTATRKLIVLVAKPLYQGFASVLISVMKTDVISDIIAVNFEKVPHFKSELVWDGEYDESLLDALDCSLSAQEWQPPMDDNGLGSFDPFEVNTPTRKSYYPFVDKKNGIIGGL